MLDGYGLHSLIWNLADQVVSDILVASPMDAQGRGIALEVREAGVAADLEGATVYLVWTHRGTGKRGTTAFEAVDASAGKFSVYYPAAMCGAGGIVDAAIVLSLDDGRYLSTRDFSIRVERVLIDGLEPEDGFTLFLQAIAAYENAGGISTEAATAANAAADAANAAAGNAAQAIADLQAAAAAGDFDGEDGADGADGFSPVATVTQNESGGATITITDKNGTTSADISKGAQGEKGDKGDPGERGPKGDKGDAGPQGIQGETGPQGEKGETGAAGARGPQGEAGPKGDTGATGPQGERGEKGDTGDRGPQGAQGEVGPAGAKGDKGDDGVSCTHSWDGTVLSVTSASGTSSADLVGPQGAQGERGPAGADGTSFTPVPPLSLSGDGELAIDLSGYATIGAAKALYADWICPATAEARSDGLQRVGYEYQYPNLKAGDYLLNARYCTLGVVNEVTFSSGTCYARVTGVLDWGKDRMFATATSIDADPGGTASGYIPAGNNHVYPEGCILFNPDTGNLMMVTAKTAPSFNNQSTPVSVLGLCNLYGSGAAFEAASPLSLSDGGVLSIDLSGYARDADLPSDVIDATVHAGMAEERGSATFTIASYSPLYPARVGDRVYDTRLDRVGVVTAVADGDGGGKDVTVKTVYDLGKLRGIVTTTTLDVAAGETGSGSVDAVGHTILAGTLVLNTSTGNLMRATATAKAYNDSYSPTVQVEGIGNVLAPDLSGYAALSGATFTGAVSGVTPTANAHFATKAYVDGLLANLMQEVF